MTALRLHLSSQTKHIIGLVVVAISQLLLTAFQKAESDKSGIRRFMVFSYKGLAFYAFYALVGIVSLSAFVDAAAGWLSRASSSRTDVKVRLWRLTLTAGLVSVAISGVLIQGLMMFCTFIKQIGENEGFQDQPLPALAAMLAFQTWFEEFAKLFALFFTFRKIVLVPLYSVNAGIPDQPLPCLRRFFVAGAACVGLGFCVLENFMYFAIFAHEQSYGSTALPWVEVHAVALVRTVQCVHCVWATISAVVFLRLGEKKLATSLGDEHQLTASSLLGTGFKPARVLKAISLSWTLHWAFNFSALFLAKSTTLNGTLALGLTLSLAAVFSIILRTIATRYLRSIDRFDPRNTLANSLASLRL